MEDYQSYVFAWGVYGALGLILYGLLWIGVGQLRWAGLRWYLRYVFAVTLIVPWQGTDPQPYLAPAIIVGGFEMMDSGIGTMLNILAPMLALWVAGLVLWLLISIVMRKRQQRETLPHRPDPDPAE